MDTTLFASLGALGADLGISSGLFWGIFVLVALWTLIFKGFALWYSARNYQRRWFIVLLVLNTFGILEIVYLIWFRKDRSGQQSLFTSPDGVSSSAV